MFLTHVLAVVGRDHLGFFSYPKKRQTFTTNLKENIKRSSANIYIMHVIVNFIPCRGIKENQVPKGTTKPQIENISFLERARLIINISH